MDRDDARYDNNNNHSNKNNNSINSYDNSKSNNNEKDDNEEPQALGDMYFDADARYKIHQMIKQRDRLQSKDSNDIDNDNMNKVDYFVKLDVSLKLLKQWTSFRINNFIHEALPNNTVITTIHI
jgi:hypothetical protein